MFSILIYYIPFRVFLVVILVFGECVKKSQIYWDGAMQLPAYLEHKYPKCAMPLFRQCTYDPGVFHDPCLFITIYLSIYLKGFVSGQIHLHFCEMLTI